MEIPVLFFASISQQFFNLRNLKLLFYNYLIFRTFLNSYKYYAATHSGWFLLQKQLQIEFLKFKTCQTIFLNGINEFWTYVP